MNYWVVPVIIGKRERFWETAEALFSYLLFQYDSSIEDWRTAGDALYHTCFLLILVLFGSLCYFLALSQIALNSPEGTKNIKSIFELFANSPL